jgi:hypothetical protein
VKTRRVYNRAVAACWLALAVAPFWCAHALDFSRIEYWSGEGTNRAALVVDWNNGGRPEALAWGFRWNGEATALNLWQAVTNADRGLTGIMTNDGGKTHITGVEYRRPSRPGDLLPATDRHDVYRTAFSRDYTGEVFKAGAWLCWNAIKTNYTPGDMAQTADSVQHIALSNDHWLALSFTPEAATEMRRPGFALPAVHYPYASSVMGFYYGAGTVPVDPVDKVTPFDHAPVVLGRPTVDTTGEWDEPGVPVVPVQPAFRAFELVSIGEGGFIEVAFAHPVLDHPDNPFGSDLIVYGNGFQNLSSGRWTNGSPHLSTVGTNGNYEAGLVSVSQDGVHWIALTNGPYADAFAPTLGRVYDPDRVDTNLGTWNAWWGGPADPTLPLDPALNMVDWSGMTVAEISARYRGSAGGTAFDLAGLELDPDPDTGRKWIRYVRIERMGATNPEVDAVADVSPVAPYEHWRMAHFGWRDDPQDERDDADIDEDSAPTLLEYALGRDPVAADDEPFMAMSMDEHGIPQVMMKAAPPDVRLELEACHDLRAAAWCDTETEAENGTAHRFFRMRVRHD